MTEPADDRIQTALDLATTLDWRVGRTWAAFIGSALVIGCVLSVILLIVSVFVPHKPPGGVSEGVWFIRMLLMLLFFVPLVVFLRHLAQRTRQAATQETSGCYISPSTWVGTALDILVHVLWLVIAFLTCAALFRLAGPSYNLFQTERTGMGAVWITLGLVVQDMPALLRRWATPKAPLPPSSPEQAGDSREQQP